MFLLLSVFVLASVAIPEVAPGPCQTLRQCVRDLSTSANGHWRWLFMAEFPGSHNRWINYINSTCNDWQGRSACNTHESRQACRNFTTRLYAHYERKNTQMLCSPRGRQFYERIYTEAPHCIGNSIITPEALAMRESCLAQRGLTTDSYRSDMLHCANATAARDCYREWVGDRCGDLFRWLLDKEWDVRFQVYFPNCPRPSRFQWPSS